MRKSIVLPLLLMMSIELFAGGRPVQIIRCVDRNQVNNLNRVAAFMASDTTDHFCYPGLLTVVEPAGGYCGSANNANTIFTISITADTLLPNDALTINSLTNIMLTDQTDSLSGTIDFTTTDVRLAFTADGTATVEIDFTRDPYQESIIEFRNAVLDASGTKILRIPACTTIGSTIPTMGQWGLISLGLLLLIFGISAVRQSHLVAL